MSRSFSLGGLFLIASSVLTAQCHGQTGAVPSGPATIDVDDLTSALSPERTSEVHKAVDQGLKWLVTQQNADGSFKSNTGHEAFTTCYAELALMSRGHFPSDRDEYGQAMDRGIEFLLSIQKPNGVFQHKNTLGKVHALSGTALCELYGGTTGARSDQLRIAIEKAIAFTVQSQTTQPMLPGHHGGWDSAKPGRSYLAETVTHLIFLRSARENGFQVPQKCIDDAIAYTGRCFVPESGNRETGIFQNKPWPQRGATGPTFGRTGMGMLSLQLHGHRGDWMVIEGAKWLVSHPIPKQGEPPLYYWHCYLAAYAMAQAGGEYWQDFYPRLVDRMMSYQEADGSWDQDFVFDEGRLQSLEKSGPAVHTSLVVLMLTLPDQILPIHQR